MTGVDNRKRASVMSGFLQNLLPTGRPARRQFLADTGLGFTGLALGAMLQQDASAGTSETPVARQPLFAPKAKSVIWYCNGKPKSADF